MIPLTLVTGFLGSGKTTLLQRVVERNRARRLAYVVNEFGETAVDGHLLEVGENEWRFVRSGLGKYIYGEILMRPVNTKARFRIPVDGPVEKFSVRLQAEGPAEIYLKVGNLLRKRFDVYQGTLQEKSFAMPHVFRREIVKVSLLADGGAVRLASLGFV